MPDSFVLSRSTAQMRVVGRCRVQSNQKPHLGSALWPRTDVRIIATGKNDTVLRTVRLIELP